MLPRGYKTIIAWFEEVAQDPKYANPEFVRFDDGVADEETWEGYDGAVDAPVAVAEAEAQTPALAAAKGKMFELGNDDDSD